MPLPLNQNQLSSLKQKYPWLTDFEDKYQNALDRTDKVEFLHLLRDLEIQLSSDAPPLTIRPVRAQRLCTVILEMMLPFKDIIEAIMLEENEMFRAYSALGVLIIRYIGIHNKSQSNGVSKEDTAQDIYKFVCSMFNGDPHYIIDTLLLSCWGQEAHLHQDGSVVHYGLRFIINDYERYYEDPLAFLKYLCACKVLYDERQGKNFVRAKLSEIGVGPRGLAELLRSKGGMRLNWEGEAQDVVPLRDLMKNFKCKRVFAISQEHLTVQDSDQGPVPVDDDDDDEDEPEVDKIVKVEKWEDEDEGRVDMNGELSEELETGEDGDVKMEDENAEVVNGLDDSAEQNQNQASYDEEGEAEALDDEGEPEAMDDEGEPEALDDEGEPEALDDEGEPEALDDEGEPEAMDDEGEPESLDDEAEAETQTFQESTTEYDNQSVGSGPAISIDSLSEYFVPVDVDNFSLPSNYEDFLQANMGPDDEDILMNENDALADELSASVQQNPDNGMDDGEAGVLDDNPTGDPTTVGENVEVVDELNNEDQGSVHDAEELNGEEAPESSDSPDSDGQKKTDSDNLTDTVTDEDEGSSMGNFQANQAVLVQTLGYNNQGILNLPSSPACQGLPIGALVTINSVYHLVQSPGIAVPVATVRLQPPPPPPPQNDSDDDVLVLDHFHPWEIGPNGENPRRN